MTDCLLRKECAQYWITKKPFQCHVGFTWSWRKALLTVAFTDLHSLYIIQTQMDQMACDANQIVKTWSWQLWNYIKDSRPNCLQSRRTITWAAHALKGLKKVGDKAAVSKNRSTLIKWISMNIGPLLTCKISACRSWRDHSNNVSIANK